MILRSCIPLLTLALSSLLILALADGVCASSEEEAGDNIVPKLLDEVVEWTKANGGWMSHKVEIRSIGTNGLAGIFAKDALTKGEAVLDIPWQLIIQPPHLASQPSLCGKVENVRKRITDPQTPYERYLATRTAHKPPYFWSQAGKTLLKELFVGFVEKGFEQELGDQYQQICYQKPTASHLGAMALIETRGEGMDVDLLAPIGDLLNHRNGNYTNVDPELTPGVRYEIITTRAVKAGEQLQNAYNQCAWCRMYRNPQKADAYHVTPQLFEIYGFVELLPQRWVVPSQRLLFDIVETPYGPKAVFAVKPSRKGVAFLEARLVLLQGFQEKHQGRTDIPAKELNDIFDFYDAVVTAFRLAIEAAEGNTSEYVWKLALNKWYWETN